ncbi:hypothetical protein [Arthrobacter sp. CAN_A1]|uniref:hypothetical protein n=1 Tax=Arthrobacter sp. CAN_A1 TaxID=2787717 RepID=UPI0018CAD830
MSTAADLTPIGPPSDPEPGGITVRGGVGSIRFQWDELRQGSVRLGLLADELREALHFCGDLQWRLQLLLKGQEAAVRGAGDAAVAAMDTARMALGRSDDDLRDTAQRIEWCRLSYESSEALTQLATAAARKAVGEIERGLHRAIDLANAGNFAEPAPISVECVSAPERLTLDGSVPALLQRVDAVKAEGPGVFEVLKVQGTGGPVYVVVLPGTQGSNPAASSNPFDPTGVVEAVHHDSVFVADAVRRALSDAGARQGDSVMMVGYSQGGMHAANLAQDQGIADDFNLQLVLTAGAPTGREPSGGGTSLQLEHADDWVHQVDGTPNSDERDRVTVTLRNPVAEVQDGDEGLGAAHKLGTYLDGAEAVESSAHPSIVASVGVLRAAIGVGASAERHVFRAQRRLPAGGAKPGTGRQARVPGITRVPEPRPDR